MRMQGCRKENKAEKVRGGHEIQDGNQNCKIKNYWKLNQFLKLWLGRLGRFVRPYEGPYTIMKIIPLSVYEIADRQGRIRG